MQPQLRFEPVSFSWVALHPQPKGVLQFIGGAFFGSLPTLFYRYLLRQLFEAGYTLIVFPFRFSFRHWSIALSLLEEQRRLRPILQVMASQAGYKTELYSQPSSYAWIGHSLGCKYIALLELLSGHDWQADIADCIDAKTLQYLAMRLPQAEAIRGQPSLLMAPDISDTESAIPIKPIARWLDHMGWGAKPTRRQTKNLIKRSRLFRLTAMISFDRDSIAGSVLDQEEEKSDVLWLVRQLQPAGLLNREIPGKHLEPIGIQLGRYLVDLNPLDKFIKPLSDRQLEQVALELLDLLEERSQLSAASVPLAEAIAAEVSA